MTLAFLPFHPLGHDLCVGVFHSCKPEPPNLPWHSLTSVFPNTRCPPLPTLFKNSPASQISRKKLCVEVFQPWIVGSLDQKKQMNANSYCSIWPYGVALANLQRCHIADALQRQLIGVTRGLRRFCRKGDRFETWKMRFFIRDDACKLIHVCKWFM